MTLNSRHYLTPLVTCLLMTGLSSSTVSLAQDSKQTSMDVCLLKAFKESSPETTVAEISKTCELLVKSGSAHEIKNSAIKNDIGVLALKESVEELSSDVPFILNAHRANYLLPAVYVDNPNSEPFNSEFGPASLDNTEVQFQLSLKAPIITEGLFFDHDSLWIGYSMRAFWQAYNSINSSPFRETNHEPELIWETENHLEFLGFENASNQIVLNHQSNGRSGELSRSWNRLIVNSAWERGKLAFSLSAWERFKEDVEEDDNPRIETFIGNLQLMASYGQDNHRVSTMIRGNPVKGKGAAELTWSFPIRGSEKIRGMVKYFDGYGESLLDYDVRTRSFGVGFQVTDWF